MPLPLYPSHYFFSPIPFHLCHCLYPCSLCMFFPLYLFCCYLTPLPYALANDPCAFGNVPCPYNPLTSKITKRYGVNIHSMHTSRVANSSFFIDTVCWNSAQLFVYLLQSFLYLFIMIKWKCRWKFKIIWYPTHIQISGRFRGFWGEYRSFWSGISDRIGPGPQSVSDQFPKIQSGSGRTGNC